MNHPDSAPDAPRSPTFRHDPQQIGTDGLWLFVFIDMVIFTLIFFVFMTERLDEYSLFKSSQTHLNEVFGLCNTLVLLTSSWLVVEAVHAARRGAPKIIATRLALALVCGLMFVASKIIEYRAKILLGFSPATNPFFSFYYFITFVHFLHVVAGMMFLNSYRQRSIRCLDSPAYTTGLENVGVFWHYVDVLWIFIFPLLYLV